MATFWKLDNPPTHNLLRRLVVYGIIGQAVLLVLLFVPGTLHYWQGWSFMVVNFVVTHIFVVYFYRHDHELLARRMLRKETIRTQKIIMFLIKRVAVAFYVFCGLDHRFGWSGSGWHPCRGGLRCWRCSVTRALFCSTFR